MISEEKMLASALDTHLFGDVEIELSDDIDLYPSFTAYGYFSGYGVSPDQSDVQSGLDLITDEHPRYPTNNVVELNVVFHANINQENNLMPYFKENFNADAYRIIEARMVDTSNPENPRGDWYSISDFE